MSNFASIQNRISVTGFDGKSAYSNQDILDLIQLAYEGSTGYPLSFAAEVDAWLNAPQNAGKNLEITWLQPGAPLFPAYAYLGAGQVFMNPEGSEKLLYLSTQGRAERHTALSVLLHEFGHALTGWGDDPTYANLKGDNIRVQTQSLC